jgi:hypothetical protein
MATPILSKRKAEGLESEPTAVRKAPRTDDDQGAGADEDLDTLLRQLQQVVQRIKKINPSDCSEEQLEVATSTEVELSEWSDRVEELQEALRNPPPVETPIPFDELVQVLSHLEAASLASAAQVSRHFARAVPEAIHMVLDQIASRESDDEGTFKLRDFDTYCPRLLGRVEKDLELVPKLIQGITRNADRATVRKLEVELLEAHYEVLFLYRDSMWTTLKRMRLQEKTACQRGLLLFCLSSADIPAEELSEYATVVVEQLRSPLESKIAIYGLSLFKNMLPAVHIEHFDLLLEILQDSSSDDYSLTIAVRLADKSIPIATLKAHMDVFKLLKNAVERELSEAAQMLCWRLEHHVPK